MIKISLTKKKFKSKYTSIKYLPDISQTYTKLIYSWLNN